MNGLELNVPARRTSAWVVETDPRYARAWLGALPLADSSEVARELYQALYTLNRQAIEPERRLGLMVLYEPPVASVCQALQSHLSRPVYPLSARKRQIAEFVRQLQVEMSAGYKHCLMDFLRQRFVWRYRTSLPRVAHRVIYYLGQTLLRSYQTYLPYPPDLWRDLHRVYSHAENAGWLDTGVEAPGGEPPDGKYCIARDYLRTLLLASSEPYQLPQDECLLVYRLLEHVADKASLTQDVRGEGNSGCFMIDLDADAPPVALVLARTPSAADTGRCRLLNTTELVRTLNGFVHRLQRGEPVSSLGLGIDCLEATGNDLLQRLIRAWGVKARRQHKRIKKKEYLSLCVGIPALNYFISGQHMFRTRDDDSVNVTADLAAGDTIPAIRNQAGNRQEIPPDTGQDTYRVDRWQVIDVSPRGLHLSQTLGAGASVRVGDALGVQRPDQPGIWSVAVVRWLKNPTNDLLEVGVELLGPQARSVTVRVLAATGTLPLMPALAVLLPPVEPLHKPATLVVPRGYYQADADYELQQENQPVRRVRALQLLERSGSFEQMVYADLLPE